MDATRRHELQENQLRAALERSPDYFRKYASTILLALVAVAVVAYVIYQRRATARDFETATQTAIYNMTNLVTEAELLRGEFELRPVGQFARERDRIANDFDENAAVAAQADRPAQQAVALRLQGDMYWTLATLPELPPQPEAAPGEEEAVLPMAGPFRKSRQQLLSEAESAYGQVRERYPGHAGAGVAALFGLAAIAEERGQFDVAETHYEQVRELSSAPPSARRLAESRVQILDLISRQPRLAPPRPQPDLAPPTEPVAPEPGMDLQAPPPTIPPAEAAPDAPADAPAAEPVEPVPAN